LNAINVTLNVILYHNGMFTLNQKAIQEKT
jgi:hypothetical protein